MPLEATSWLPRAAGTCSFEKGTRFLTSPHERRRPLAIITSPPALPRSISTNALMDKSALCDLTGEEMGMCQLGKAELSHITRERFGKTVPGVDERRRQFVWWAPLPLVFG